MLARMWLNALSDGSAINAQARSIYVRALTKPSIARSRITTPCRCLSSVLNFKKFKSNTHGYCKLDQTVPRTAGVSPIIRQNRVQGNTITGTVSFRVALFKPILGVIKWYANGCLPFTTSRSAGSEVNKSGMKKLNSMNKNHSGMKTSKKCQTEQRQIQESSKTMRASSKHSTANGHMDVAETSKSMKTQSRSKSKIAKANPSPNNNKRPSSTLLKREIIVQEPISSSTEPFTTSGSAGIDVKKSGTMKLNSSKKKLSGVNTSKKCQTEQRRIQESSKTTKASSKHSPAIYQVDVAKTGKLVKTLSSSKSKIEEGKPSLPKNNEEFKHLKCPKDTLLEREKNFQDCLHSTLLRREIIVQEPISSSTEPFKTSGSAGIDVKKSGTMKLNSSKKKLSGVNTSKKYQTEQRQIQEISKTTKASWKDSPAIDQVDVAKTGKLVKTLSSSKSNIEEGKPYLPKNNEEFKHLQWPKDTLLERETNFQDSLHSTLLRREIIVQEPISSSTEPYTTSGSAVIDVKKSGTMKLNSSKKKLSGVNTSKKCQREQWWIQESSKTTKASSKHYLAIDQVDVAKTGKLVKTLSSLKSKIEEGKPSLQKNNEEFKHLKWPKDTLLERETNFQDSLHSTLLKREIIVQEPISSSTEPFTTAGSTGIDVKKSGLMKLNSSKKKLSGMNTSKKCQTEQRRIQESSKTTKASSKYSPAIDQVDVAKTGKLVKTLSSSKSKIEEGKPSLPKNNEEFKQLKWTKDTLLERETNFQDSLHSTLLKMEIIVQETISSTTEPFTTSGSAGIDVKKSGTMKLNSSKKKLSGVNTSKKCQTEQRRIRESSKTTRASSKHSPAIDQVDVAKTGKLVKTLSSSKSKIEEGKPSLPKNNEEFKHLKWPKDTLLEREPNLQDSLHSPTELTTASHKPQAKTLEQSKVNKSESTNKNNIKIEKIDKKTSSKDGDQKPHVAVIGAKTRSLPKVINDE